MNTVAIQAEVRENIGKTGSRKVRATGRIPAVIYGDGNPLHVHVDPMNVRPLIYTPDFKLAEIDVEGEKYSCILKEVQFHPVTDEVFHIDFLRLTPGRPVKVELPIRFKGESPGVRQGGKLIQKMRRAKVLTTPEHLIDELRVDITGVKMGESIRVRDIETKDGIQIMSSPAIPVATVNIPRSMRSAATAEKKAALKEAKTGDKSPQEEI